MPADHITNGHTLKFSGEPTINCADYVDQQPLYDPLADNDSKNMVMGFGLCTSNSIGGTTQPASKKVTYASCLICTSDVYLVRSREH